MSSEKVELCALCTPCPYITHCHLINSIKHAPKASTSSLDCPYKKKKSGTRCKYLYQAYAQIWSSCNYFQILGINWIICKRWSAYSWWVLSKYLLKWNDINSALIFFQVDRHFPNFLLYIILIFSWLSFIYFGEMFKLLYALLNLKSVVDLIYTVFSGH